MCFLFNCVAGLKPLADILHGILNEWGISANADDSPSTWDGVTCAENDVDILELDLNYKQLRGNKLLCMMVLLICDSRIIIITCYFDSCYLSSLIIVVLTIIGLVFVLLLFLLL